MAKFAPEMRLLSPTGERLYLTAEEREKYLNAAIEEDPIERMYCQILYYTGCRPSEALELTPGRILIEEQSIVFRCLKKRKTDSKGRVKQPEYRTVPVPKILIEHLDLVFDIRQKQKKQKSLNTRLFNLSRPTAYRLVKRVMDRASIKGKQATGKGLRHSFGVNMVSGPKPLQIHVLAQIMGHSSTKTTEVYLRFVGEEKRKLVMEAWEE
ncbi:site-specific integrase [Desulfobacter hydrogenophilus]|uniref:Site-specific integrase n=1 Tax=Desulfobacter hydrogenophilus TaxID=2291 RepID=A0A328FA33_9BACT|nr:site-specific integrase [Desulfobacter hydrogenophilus]NDY73069.1 site-specific integrase [Desulfobacter hydrogenophilus]QBH13580.1 site-specific integrase [Desulfobacter hydrogenophilus]RAM01076.1 site-specific integrase [Desulfobacter hydrogenophilus]